MAVIAFDPNTTRPYSLRNDPSARLEFLLSLPEEQQKEHQAEIKSLTEKGIRVDDKTVFHIGTLDGPLRSYLNDDALSFSVNTAGTEAPSTVKGKGNTMKMQQVRFGLKGWENFRDAQGNLVKYETQSIPLPGIDGGNRTGLSQRAFKAINPDWYDELSTEIMRTNNFTEEERKN